MTVAYPVTSVYPVITDIDGQPLEGGYVWIGQSDLDPQTNPIQVYWDKELTITAPQPIRTIGGYFARSGSPANIYAATDFSMRVMNKNGSIIYSAPKGSIAALEELAMTQLRDDLASTAAGKGAELVAFKQAGVGAVDRTSLAKMREVVSVFDFMTAAQIADIQAGTLALDVTSAIQAAVNSLNTTGGTLYFPRGRYKVTAQINVQSTRPIHLVGHMSGQLYDPAQAPSGIVIGANIAGSIIRYAAPTSRAQHGGGNISGLAFYDATGSGATPGIYTCNAALDLYDFALSSVQDCSFHWINGGAILGEFVVMSTFRNNHIRYCGTASKPAMWFPSTSTSYPLQSADFDGNRIEVCRGAPYMVLGANSSDCKIRANGFETDTSVTPANQEFLTLNGAAHQVVGNHFNRTSTTQMTLAGQSCTVVGNSFRGNPYATTALIVSGNRNTITGNSFQSNRTAYEVDITGPYNVFNANTLYYSGAVRVASVGNSVTGNLLNFCTATTANLGAGNDWWIQEVAGGTATSSVIANNLLSNLGGGVSTTGGIRVNGTTPSVTGNSFNAFNGSGNGAVCVRVESSNAVVGGNVEANCTTLISTSGIGSCELYGNFAASGGTALPLTGSKTYDPPAIADGTNAITFVSVPGAALGDFAVVSFSNSLQGITLTGYVSAAGNVEVVFQNETGSIVDLASGVLKARVLKR